MHLVLLHLSTREVVHGSRCVALHLQLGRRERPLLADENVEVVIRGVYASVSFRAQRRAENDDVLRDTRVDNVHRTHGTACVVEHPLRRVRVQRDARVRVCLREVLRDVVDHEVDVVRVGRRGDRGLRELVQALGVEVVEAVLS